MHNFATKKLLEVKVNLLKLLKVKVHYIFIEAINLSGFTNVNYELFFSSETRQTIVKNIFNVSVDLLIFCACNQNSTIQVIFVLIQDVIFI